MLKLLLIVLVIFVLLREKIFGKFETSNTNESTKEADSYIFSSNWYDLDDTSLGHWIQETLGLSGTEVNIWLWMFGIVLLLSLLTGFLDWKWVKDKVSINFLGWVAIILLIGGIMYGVVFKSETVQNWLNSASNTSWFGNSIDTKQRLTFKKVGESKEVTMGIGSQLTVDLPSSPPNTGMVNKVCFKLIGPPVLAESKELPEKVLKNMDGERKSNTHNFVLDEELGALMGKNSIGHVMIRATIQRGIPGNIICS